MDGSTLVASLEEVMDGTAPSVYQDAAAFYENTYMTSGLSRLLKAALGRLTADAPTHEPAVIRLEGGFGFGKSHCLIGLYHAALGRADAGAISLSEHFVMPPPDSVRIAAVTASRLDPVSGRRHVDAITYTIWGEIAYQLGGKRAYDLVAESDQSSKSAPTLLDWQRIVGDHPTLIMIDELGEYLRGAESSRSTNGNAAVASALQAIASLVSYFASRTRAVLVVTQATFKAQSNRISRDLLSDTSTRAGWPDLVITPAMAAEQPAIVRQQLFRKIDPSIARATASAYQRKFRDVIEAGEDLPSQATSDAYAGLIETQYPFHPELLATISAFCGPRAALRLLATAVRVLWERQPVDCELMHAHHLDLRSEEIATMVAVTEPLLQRVIEADIVSADQTRVSNAQAIDASIAGEAGVGYARRVATAIFLNSLGESSSGKIRRADLLLGVIQPGDDLDAVRLAMGRLEELCWFLEVDRDRYRFTTRPLPERIRVSQVGLQLTDVRAAEGPDRDQQHAGNYVVSFSDSRLRTSERSLVTAEVSDLSALVSVAGQRQVLYEGLAQALFDEVGQDLVDLLPEQFRGTPVERLMEVLATENPRHFLERTLGAVGIGFMARRLNLPVKSDVNAPVQQILGYFGFASPVAVEILGLAQVLQKIARSQSLMVTAHDMVDVRGAFLEAAISIEAYILMSVRGWANSIFGRNGDAACRTVLGSSESGHGRDLNRLPFGSTVTLFERLPDHIAESPEVRIVEQKFGQRHIYRPKRKATRFSERLRALGEQRNRLAHADAGTMARSDIQEMAKTSSNLLDDASRLFSQMAAERALPRVATATEEIKDQWGRLRYRLLLDDGAPLEINRSQAFPLGKHFLHFASGTNPRPVDPLYVLLDDLVLPNRPLQSPV
jgi:hypothetical protein